MELDKKFLELREEKYDKDKCTVNMWLKHINRECNCLKKGKKCIGFIDKDFVIDFEKLSNRKYIEENLELLNSIYPVIMSITQSLRSKTGKDFEDCFEYILKEEGFKKNVHYDTQIYITEKGEKMYKKRPKEKSHSIDFIIPSIKYPNLLSKFEGNVISLKTSFRERALQDKFLISKCNLIFISLEDTKYEGSTTIQVGKDLTNWIKELKKKMNI